MQIGDLVLDKVIDEMGIVVEKSAMAETCWVVRLSDDTHVLTCERDLDLVASGSLI
tara:strand:+ start:186 stop:353 length:168 start_codon:yes stop_codon:yes gene_type:complete